MKARAEKAEPTPPAAPASDPPAAAELPRDALAAAVAELPERIAESLAKLILGRRAHNGPSRGAPRELLEKREAARRLGTQVETIYELIKSGQLEVVMCGTREKLRARDIERLVEEGWSKGPAPAAKKKRARRSRVEEQTARSGEELARAIAGIKV